MAAPRLREVAPLSGGLAAIVTDLVIGPRFSFTRPLARKTLPTVSSKSIMPSRSVSVNVAEPDPPASSVTSNPNAGLSDRRHTTAISADREKQVFIARAPSVTINHGAVRRHANQFLPAPLPSPSPLPPSWTQRADAAIPPLSGSAPTGNSGGGRLARQARESAPAAQPRISFRGRGRARGYVYDGSTFMPLSRCQ